MMVLVSVGLFGSRNALGTGKRGIRGFFVSCQEGAKKAAKIEQIAELTESLVEYVFKIWSDVNNKLFMVTTELAALKTVQKKMPEVQSSNRKYIQKHFELFEQNIHVLCDCDQLFFSQQQINFIYDTIYLQLEVTFANIKSYRSALYTYRINMMNSIQPYLNQYLTTSVVPRQSL